MGVLPLTYGELKQSDLIAAFAHDVNLTVPTYVEDDPGGVGSCAVCGKRGVLGRCKVCGLLMHLTCVGSDLPGEEQKCPRCRVDPSYSELPEEPWRMGIHSHKFGSAATGQSSGEPFSAPAAPAVASGRPPESLRLPMED